MPERIFNRILCGVDGTPESLVGVRQAARLCDTDGSITLVTVTNVDKAAHAGIAAPHAADLLERDAERALAEAREVAPSADHRLVHGPPAAMLLREAEVEQASLIALGTHGRGRAAGILLGTVAARMLRDAPCPVLIAREPRDPSVWPQTVVAGVDGSPGSAASFSVAASIVQRFGGTLRAVAATRDQLDRDAAHAIAPELEEESAHAVDALTAASESADLVVVGSRGLNGLKALGSVSERVAHQASSSVIVVHTG